MFSCHLAETLAERGNRVLVVAASDRGRSYCEEKGNLKVARINSIANPARVGQRFLLWPVREIHAALQEFRPEVIHLHDPFQLADIAIAYARKVNIPAILTIHGHPGLITSMLPGNTMLQRMVEEWLWGIATHMEGHVQAWVTPTESNARLVERHTAIHPIVISNGIDLQSFSDDPLSFQVNQGIREHLGIPEKARIVLHVGRLDPGKNVHMVIQAAAQVIKGDLCKNIHLLVVGDGIEKNALQKQAETLGISSACHFPGYIRDKEILSAIYRCSDLFLMSSIIETQGIVLLEAAASGLPIVAVNATAIPEVVIHGVNGFLVPAGDVKSMARHIGEILNDGNLLNRMRLASRQVALQHDFKRSVDAYEHVYSSVLSEGQVVTKSIPVSIGLSEVDG
jgi:glycosyltransferase involved in cell wall biosynthesis